MKTPTDSPTRRVRVEVNGTPIVREVECRKHLIDFLREDCGLKGSHLGLSLIHISEPTRPY